MKSHRRSRFATVLLACLALAAGPAVAGAAAATAPSRQRATPIVAARAASGARPTELASAWSVATASLESVATKAGETGRNVAMSLIGLALAIAAVVLAFRRDFKEAAAVFAVGLVCVLMATSAGETLLQDTVNALVGS